MSWMKQIVGSNIENQSPLKSNFFEDIVMVQDIEAKYDQFLAELQSIVGPVDPNFAMRLMYLERKMAKSVQSSIKPHVALTIKLKSEVNRESKVQSLRSKGLMVEGIDEPNTILVMGYMDMNNVADISADAEIEKITGKASPVIRG